MTRRNPERGSVLILIALCMTLFIGVAALVVDASYGFDLRNRLSAVADSAALSAAWEIYRNNGDQAALEAFANREVDNAMSSAARLLQSNTVTRTIRRCDDAGATCTSPYNTSRYVEVILEQQSAGFFAPALNFVGLNPRARAVAGISKSHACFVTLEGISWETNNTLTAIDCAVEIGGDSNLGNNTQLISGTPVGVVGARTGGGTYSPRAIRIPLATDPLALLPAPAVPAGSCTDLTLNSDTSITPGKYCHVHWNSSATLTLASGTYYIGGLWDDQSSGVDVTIDASAGVFVYIYGPDGQLRFSSNDFSMDVRALTSGVYAGVAMFQARDDGNAADFGKNGNGLGIRVNGALYFPNAELGMKNHSPVSDCGIVVARTLDVKNDATIQIEDQCADFTGSPLQTVALAE